MLGRLRAWLVEFQIDSGRLHERTEVQLTSVALALAVMRRLNGRRREGIYRDLVQLCDHAAWQAIAIAVRRLAALLMHPSMASFQATMNDDTRRRNPSRRGRRIIVLLSFYYSWGIRICMI